MADAKKEDAEGEGAAEAPKPKGKKKLIIIIAVVLLAVGGAAFVFLGGKPEVKEEKKEDVEEEKVYATAKLDTFIVNLSEASTFLKVTILIEYDPALLHAKTDHGGGEAEGGGHGAGGGGDEAKAGGLPPIIEKRKPMINDAIIRVLSSKKSSDLLTAEGKEQLKLELIEAINEAMGMDESPVVNIYFMDFIIQ